MLLLKGNKKDIVEISNFIKAKNVIGDIVTNANTDLSLFRRVLSDELNYFLDENNLTQLWDLIHLSESDFKILWKTTFVRNEVREEDCLRAFFTLDLILKEFNLAFAPEGLRNIQKREVNTIKLYMLLIENDLANKGLRGEEGSQC